MERFFVVIFAVFSLAGCDEPNDPRGKDGWHIDGVSEVRVYRINWDNVYGEEMLVNFDGELNDTRQPKEGIPLNGTEIEQLQSAIYGHHPDHPRHACFYPHHAFALIDSNGEIIGTIDVCFLCTYYRAMPSGFAANWDLEALRDLLEGMEIPISNPEW